MSPAGTRPSRTVVCGTGFGRIHLRAVHTSPDVELVGVLSRGSDASRQVAAGYDVPTFTDVAELPDDVDVACVAVPAAPGAGDGAVVAQRLLARGLHVLQEHPLHPDELAACLRIARDHNVQYRVNSLYPHVEPVRQFLAAAEVVRRQQRPLFIDAVCGVQVLYSLLDVVGRAVGGMRPWRFANPSPIPADLAALAATPSPYTSVQGVVGGVPLTLRVQNQLNPSDPDNHALLLHRITVGFEGGVLALADTHGPVLWSPRLHSARADGRLVLDGPGTERLDVASTERLDSPEATTFLDLFERVWPDAVGVALGELCRDIQSDSPTGSEAQAAQWVLSVTALWQDLSARLGPVELIDPPEPGAVPAKELL